MRLFLDPSVLLAASGSGKGASRFLITEAVRYGWELVSSDYCDEETRRNLPKVGRSAAVAWKNAIAPRVRFVRASVALDKPLVFPKAKDRPVVITALASGSPWLLTLDDRSGDRIGGELSYSEDRCGSTTASMPLTEDRPIALMRRSVNGR